MDGPVVNVLEIIVVRTLYLCGKLFIQNMTLYTISVIDCGGNHLNGSVLAMALLFL